jgi:hypothetical protein
MGSPLSGKACDKDYTRGKQVYLFIVKLFSYLVRKLVSQLTARYWLLVAVLTVQFVPHRKHTLSP